MNFLQNKLNIDEFDIKEGQAFHLKGTHELAINVFFLVSDSHAIETDWKVFSNAVAVKFQNAEHMSENKEFERWNFYIIYVVAQKLSKELKNKIENDRFSSRKIVEDGYVFEFDNDGANDLIIKHITNTDLKDIIDQTEDRIRVDYVPRNAELWKLIKGDGLLARETDLQKKLVQQIIRISDED